MYFADAIFFLCLLGLVSLIAGYISRALGKYYKPVPLRILIQNGNFTICLHYSVIYVVAFFAIGVTNDRIESSVFSLFSIAYMVHVLLIVVHELGHALTCKIVGAKVYGIFVSCEGGICYTDGSDNRLKAILIYASGPLADLCVLVIALMVMSPERGSIVDYAVWWALVPWNAFGIVWNLIPRIVGDRGTDGYYILHHLRNYRVSVPVESQPAHLARLVR